MFLFRIISKDITLSKIIVSLFIVIPVIALLKVKLSGGLSAPCDYNGYLILGSVG